MPCSIHKCPKPVKTNGLCAKHVAKQEMADARIAANIGKHEPDDDQLDDDKDLEGAVASTSATCTRPGCGKKLRSSNTKGTCGSGCLSAEAPAFQRAEGVDGKPGIVRAKPGPKPKAPSTPKQMHPADVVAQFMPTPNKSAAELTLEKFRQLATALGFDADETLADFAQTFIDKARTAVTAPRAVAVVAELGASPAQSAAAETYAAIGFVDTGSAPPPQHERELTDVPHDDSFERAELRYGTPGR